MTRKMHAAAGTFALILILLFWGSTVLVELFGSSDQVALVKQTILKGVVVLVGLLAVTGGSGAFLSKGHQTAWTRRKMKRMRLSAALGILVLVPSAIVLERLATSGQFSQTFYVVQGLELLAGATNVVLIGLNLRDGLSLSRRKMRPIPTDRGHQDG